MPGRLLAIGDVHGCRDELGRLLAALAPTPDDTLVFLGDYVDRGPDSCGVVERVIEMQARGACGEGPRCTALRGNHEQMMLDARAEGGHTLDNWVFNVRDERPGRTGWRSRAWKGSGVNRSRTVALTAEA